MDTNNYCELVIDADDEAVREELIARLADIGYDGFEETGSLLKAYIPDTYFIENDINKIFSNYNLTYSKSIIKKQNWNKLWESNFEPVQIEDFVGIRADFHPSFKDVMHEMVITPKMSFGTGHHATTYMVIQLMRDLNFTAKAVFDFGTGTGILAILAEKLGASKVLAVDNDSWCIENASENILINECKNIEIQLVTEFSIMEKFDIILANINKNVILESIYLLNEGLISGGQLLLSGILKEDEIDILAASSSLGLHHRSTLERNGWIAIWLNRKS